MKKNLFILLLPALVLCFQMGPAFPSDLDRGRIPDMEGWRTEREMFQELSAPSGSYGTWHQKLFTDPSGRAVVVNLLCGEGPGELYVPPGPVSHDDRPIGLGATYETIEIEGLRGVLEYYPYAGYALAISLPDSSTLCLESKALSKEILCGFARSLVRRLFS